MSHALKNTLLLLGDICVLSLSLFITLILQSLLGGAQEVYTVAFWNYLTLHLLWILVFYIEGLYSVRTIKASSLLTSTARATFINILLAFVYFYLAKMPFAPKKTLMLHALIVFVILGGWRQLFYHFFSPIFMQVNIAMMAEDPTIREFQTFLADRKHLGLNLVKTLFPWHGADRIKNELETAIASKKLPYSILVFSKSILKDESLHPLMFVLLKRGVRIYEVSNFIENTLGKIPLASLDDSWLLEYCGQRVSKVDDALKWLVDKLLALTGIIIFIPLFVPFLFVLLAFHGWPIFYAQKRVGRFGRPYTLYKFRTMVVDAEKDGAQWSQNNDPRITALGKIMRKTRLDEVPQLLNVLKGDMSLIGPRPERPEFVDELSRKIRFYNERHLIRPGLTGWAQINYKYGNSNDDSTQKHQYDLYYLKNRNIWLDFAIILKTIKTIISGGGK